MMLHTRTVTPARGSVVTVTFELSPEIDPARFIDWLQTECSVAEDGDGAIHGKVSIAPPVTIQQFDFGQRS